MPFLQNLACLLALALLSVANVNAEALNVAVASNMSHAISEIAASFQRNTGIQVRLTFGSSGNFTRQLIQGAPYRVFLSADGKYVRKLEENNVVLLADLAFARGRIGIFIPRNSDLYQIDELSTVIKKMYHGNYSRIVMANPTHAPYGIAAQQALQKAGLWVIDKQGLLLAENAAQATQIAISGNVDVGIIPSSHALLPELADKGKFYPLPADWHAPLLHHLVLLQGASKSETQFFEYLQTEEAKEVLRKHGYSMLAESNLNESHGLAGS